MTDLDDRLRHDLAQLANRMPIQDMTDASVQRGERLRLRRRTIGATAGVAVLVAAVVVPITLAGRSTQASTSAPGNGQQVGANLDPSHGGTDLEWQVMAPILGTISPALRLQTPPCKPSEITASATTRGDPDGVVGVVTVNGAHNCTLNYTRGPTALLGPDHQRLAVRRVLGEVQPALPANGGPMAAGFAWRGSWCGPQATAVLLTGGAGPITAPLTGPSPPCDGRSHSDFVTGYAGQPDEALQFAPAAWSGLTATVSAPAVLHGTSLTSTLTGITVALHNTTGVPISLAPCPSYALTVTNAQGDGGSALNTVSPAFPCPPKPRVVPAHGSVTVALPNGELYPQDTAPSGPTKVTIQFGILGVPIATTTAIEDAY
jgi:hypothetical protein